MKTKTISVIFVTLAIASILFSVIPVMAAPANGKALDKNPNLVDSDDNWIRLNNGEVLKTAWNIGNKAGRHVVYVDTTKMGQGAIDAKIAHGWLWSRQGPIPFGTYLFKEVQPAD